MAFLEDQVDDGATARWCRCRCGSGRRSARSGAFPPLPIPSLPFPSIPLERKEGEAGAAALEGEEAAGVWVGWLGDEAEERRAVVVGGRGRGERRLGFVRVGSVRSLPARFAGGESVRVRGLHVERGALRPPRASAVRWSFRLA